ncbi:MAG: PEP-CTERM sorting domain-containing protein [Methyloversatilis discipulorum]|nr:PEP-CTERM sorting domain-containing protein [Methyloversatilis discipulorum]
MASSLNARYLRYSVNAGSPQWGYLAEIDVQGHVATVPEPETWVTMLAGLGLLGVVARRRRG